MMTRIFIAIVAVGLAAGAWGATLESGFHSPPRSARPHTWYHVMNGNATKSGITKDFEALDEIGIGGVQLFDAGCNIPAGPLAFGSPDWTDFIRHAASEAKRLGLELCLPNCSGWSSSGGPWVKPEDGMKELAYTASEVLEGPSTFNDQLPQPPFAPGGRAPFYRDIAVLAVPVPPAEERTFPGISETLPKMAARFMSERPVTAKGISFVYRYGRTYGIYGRLKVEISADGETFTELGRFKSDPCVMGIRDESVRTLRFEQPVTFKAVRVTFLFESGSILEANLKITDLKPCDRAELSSARMKRGEIRGGFVRDTFVASADQIVPEGISQRVPMAANGAVLWQVPSGRWRLYRLGYRANGRCNHPASKMGVGLEVDKFSAAALGRHFDAYLGRLCAELGPELAGSVPYGLNNVLVDSYEVGTQTWTDGFERIFKDRMGYDLEPWYPVFFGKIVGSVDRTERFLEDYRRVMADLFAENYADALAAKCHAHGLKLSLEPYGNAVCDNLRYGRNADIPMTEFWSRGCSPYSSETGDSVFVPSIAHFWGRRYVAAESFTASGSRPGGGDRGPGSGGWTTTPFAIKALGDCAYSKGVNRIVYHRFVHQPWADVPRLPGMTMGKWGMHFDRTQTWWREGAEWLRYQARCQWMLQEGKNVADFLVSCGEGIPNDCGARSDTKVEDPAKAIPLGYAHDLAGREMIAALRVEKGMLVAPSGVHYRALVLPSSETMSLAMLGTLERLVKDGAVVIGPRPPVRVPGLAGGAAAESDLRVRADSLWKQGVFASVTDWLAATKLKPDCAIDSGTAKGVITRWIHRRSEEADWYFVCCNNRVETDLTITLREADRIPELWDAEHGTCVTARRVRREKGRTTVVATLPICGSVFIVFRDRQPSVPVEPAYETVSSSSVTGSWRVAFPHAFKPNALAKGADEILVFDELADWTNRADTAAFSGSAVYTKEVSVVAPSAGERLLLDLGTVREFATVTVNGKTYPALWKPPYVLDITDSLHPLPSTNYPLPSTLYLRIRVTNLWPNKLIDDDRKSEDCRWNRSTIHGDALAEIPEWVRAGRASPTGRDTFVTWRHWRGTDRPLSSGLLGPVKLLRQKEIK